MSRKRKKPGPTLHAILALFFWAFIGIGLILSSLVARSAILYHDSSEWPATTGVVTASAVTRKFIPPQEWGFEARTSPGMYLYRASIEYRYTVDGRVYNGTRIGIGIRIAPSVLVERYPKGRAVSVYYDGEHPERALLIPGLDLDQIKFNLGMLGIFPVAGAIGLLWLARRH
jgi:hypothetical protein